MAGTIRTELYIMYNIGIERLIGISIEDQITLNQIILKLNAKKSANCLIIYFNKTIAYVSLKYN